MSEYTKTSEMGGLFCAKVGGVRYSDADIQSLALDHSECYRKATVLYLAIKPFFDLSLKRLTGETYTFDALLCLPLRTLIDFWVVQVEISRRIKALSLDQSCNYTTHYFERPPNTFSALTEEIFESAALHETICSLLLDEEIPIISRVLGQNDVRHCSHGVSEISFSDKKSNRWRLLAARLIRLSSQFSPSFWIDYTGLKVSDIALLFLRSRGKFRPIFGFNVKKQVTCEPISEERSKLSSVINELLAEADYKEREAEVGAFVLAALFPISCLEGARGALCDADREVRSCRGIFASAMLYDSDFLRLCMDLSRNKGGKILTGQHGGHYGTFRWSSLEWMERQIGEYFLTYGWGHPNEGLVPVGHPRFNNVLRRQNLRTDVLYISNSMRPRFSWQWSNAQPGAELRDYNSLRYDFCHEFSTRFKSSLSIRLHPNDNGYGIKDFIMKLSIANDWSICFDQSKDMMKTVSQSGLCIVDNNHTVILELLAANKPTFALWPEHIFKFRPEARALLKSLHDVQIWHHSVDSVVLFLERFKDYDGNLDHTSLEHWWNESHRQVILKLFVKEFARKGDLFFSGLSFGFGLSGWSDEESPGALG